MHIFHKKALSVYPKFSNFPGNFSSFSLHKNLIRIITNIKKKISQIVPAVPTEKSTFSFSRIFQFSGQLFRFFFLFKPPLNQGEQKKKINIQIGQAVFEF
jgi:hypothetical protein